MEATGVPADPNEAATAWSAEPGDDETGAAEDIEWRTIDVGAAQHGQRLDRMLADAVAEFSRSYLQQLIEQGAVSLQGKPVLKAAHKVKVGDLLRLVREADVLVHIVRSVTTPEFAGMTFHEVAARSALNRVPGASAVPFDWTVNPYRGCSHACSYCFARNTHTYLDLDAGRDFDRQIVVKPNVAEVLRRELAKPTAVTAKPTRPSSPNWLALPANCVR